MILNFMSKNASHAYTRSFYKNQLIFLYYLNPVSLHFCYLYNPRYGVYSYLPTRHKLT